MFHSRKDHISGLIDLYQQLDPSDISSVTDNPTLIFDDIETIRNFLKIEIQSFSTFIIDGLLKYSKTIDTQFYEKCIEFDPIFFGELLAKGISTYYFEIGFDSLLKIVDEINNLGPAIDGFEALFKEIIVDGEKHRTEACELTKRLQDITSREDFQNLSADQTSRVTKMIERLKPHARPIIRKMFYVEGMPLRKGEENGVSHPVLSNQGSWAEHHLLMSVLSKGYQEKTQGYKQILKK